MTIHYQPFNANLFAQLHDEDDPGTASPCHAATHATLKRTAALTQTFKNASANAEASQKQNKFLCQLVEQFGSAPERFATRTGWPGPASQMEAACSSSSLILSPTRCDVASTGAPAAPAASVTACPGGGRCCLFVRTMFARRAREASASRCLRLRPRVAKLFADVGRRRAAWSTTLEA